MTEKNIFSCNIILILSGLFFQTFCVAQSNQKVNIAGQDVSKTLNTITTAVPFLLITPDSRAGAMGDAGVATAPDANSMHWNPSKYAFVKKQTGISISYTPWLRALVPDISLAYLAGYYKLKKNGVIASSLRYFSLGDITFTDINAQVIGQFRPNEFAYDVGYATKLGEHFSGGGAIRYIHSNLTSNIIVQGSQTHAGNSVAADISGYYQGSEKDVNGKKTNWRFGANISNIGAKISYSDRGEKDFIPINMRIGSCYHVQLDDYNEISLAADFNKLLVPTPNPQDSNGSWKTKSVVSGMVGSFSDAPGGFNEELREINIGGGFEYWYAKQFALRAGYFNEPATKGGRKFINFGIGVKYSVFSLDFAYLVPTLQRHPLQNTLRFSLLFDFDAFKEKEPAPEGKN
ncbi:MAG: type IX secretion system outer membrane channel protein PorV [Bacteroidetes bacterium]|nr:type IX secretion system outer membrane channel protein PorV [Bacteroidota bacterium]